MAPMTPAAPEIVVITKTLEIAPGSADVGTTVETKPTEPK